MTAQHIVEADVRRPRGPVAGGPCLFTSASTICISGPGGAATDDAEARSVAGTRHSVFGLHSVFGIRFSAFLRGFVLAALLLFIAPAAMAAGCCGPDAGPAQNCGCGMVGCCPTDSSPPATPPLPAQNSHMPDLRHAAPAPVWAQPPDLLISDVTPTLSRSLSASSSGHPLHERDCRYQI